MSFKNIFKYYWIIFVTILVVSFWIGFFITENTYNQNFVYYEVEIQSDKIDERDINVFFFEDGLVKFNEEGKIIGYSYSTVEPKEFFKFHHINVEEKEECLVIAIRADYFIGSDEINLSNQSYDRFTKVMKKVIKYHDPNAVVTFIEPDNYVNPFLVSVISMLGGVALFFIIALFIRKKLFIPNAEIYDNKTLFKHPFSKNYWIESWLSLRKLSIFDMCLISILFAIQMLMKLVYIPSGFASLGLGVTYLIFAYICLIYGPIWGVIVGCGSDIVGFIMKPTIFNPGYTLQAMLTGLVYGLCFYKTDLRFSKVIMCRIIINILLNGIYGAFLWGGYYGLTFEATLTYMGLVALPKNIIYLIPQSILLYGFLKAAVPLLVRRGLVPEGVLKRKYYKPKE